MKSWAFILCLLLSTGALGRGISRIPYMGVRQTGMGNIGVALPDDSNMLWYNPAGLAHLKKVTWHLFDIAGGADSLDTASRALDAIFNGNTDNLVRFDTEQFRLTLKPTFFMPYFGVALYNHTNAFLDFQNFTANDIDVAVFNDTGLTVGFGLPIGKTFSLGVTAKAMFRSSSDLLTDITSLLIQYGTTLTDFESAAARIIQDNLASGYGLGFDAGALWEIPVDNKDTRVQLGAHVENLGGMAFRQYSSRPAPSSLSMKYNFGGALIYENKKGSRFTVGLDVRDPFGTGARVHKMLHLGVEYKMNWLSLRGGLMDAYPSFGVSIETPPHTKIHFSSYAQELGDNIWTRSTRFYMLQVIIGFNPL